MTTLDKYRVTRGIIRNMYPKYGNRLDVIRVHSCTPIREFEGIFI